MRDKQSHVEFIERGKWYLAALPVSRQLSGRGRLQLGVVFKDNLNGGSPSDPEHPFLLVLCEPDSLECVFTFATKDALTGLGLNVMIARGEPYTAQQIVEKGWRVD